MIPLSTENSSDGSPKIFQLLTFTGSPKTLYKEKSSEMEISKSNAVFFHIAIISCDYNVAPKTIILNY